MAEELAEDGREHDEHDGAELGEFEEDGEGGGELVPGGLRVYRRQDKAEQQRVFRWGIGNAFRMLPQNRFQPVHKPHPRQTLVREDYYDMENANVRWEELNEGWEVYWHENSKVNAKPFPVKKYGVERAKEEALAFHDKLRAEGRLHKPREHESPMPGVFYDQRLQEWICLFYRGGRPLSRTFSATKYGYEGAKMLAVAKQKDPVNGVLPVRQGGGTPLHILKELLPPRAP